ncbi:MAG: hypothetical protein NTV86_21155 [Planctomycetota bacterium]|nr:hypothetical protein [Planctomycetota bacterium]
MNKQIVTIFAWLVALAPWPYAQAGTPTAVETVTGRVTLDDTPLPGVRVSDGVGFATTGADGAYRLALAVDETIPYRAARVVSVSWPSGTWPAGPWWRRLADVAPGEAVDFALRRQDQSLPFVFLHVTDDHSDGTMYPLWAADVQTTTPAARFIINTGDLGYATAARAEGMFASVAANARSLPIPMFFVPGNHDIVPGTPGDPPRRHPLAGLGAFTKYLGPPRWSFDYAGAHFVGVDVASADSAWLRQDLGARAPGQRIFFFIHYRSGKPDQRFTHTFSGHTHSAQQIPGASVPLPLCGTPKGSPVNALQDAPKWLSMGACVMGIVGERTFRVADRCAGCRAGQPTFHLTSRCPLGEVENSLIPSLKKRRGTPAALGDPVMEPSRSVSLGAPNGSAAVEIDTRLGAPVGGRAWLRVGQATPLEVTYDGTTLVVDALPIPLRPRAGENTVALHMTVTKTALTLCANSLVRITWPVAVDNPSQVTAGASDGAGFFPSLTVWPLR